jgi:NAD(P)-dependent dehydrogenase (short-subunit alcohol dehydrogenase family)
VKTISVPEAPHSAESDGAASQEAAPASLEDADRWLARLDDAIEVLERVREQRALLAHMDDERRVRLLQAAGHVARPDPWAKRELFRAARKKRKADQRAADEQVLARTGIREKRREVVFATPLLANPPPVRAARDIDSALAAPTEPAAEVREERSCYVCKTRYRTLHFFYDSLCPKCGDFNYAKRTPVADLSSRVALVTGARVKIGYQAAIMLLRAGASVIVLTRFPRDAALRYAREPDFAQWGERLQVYGVDLRHTPSVEALCKHLLATLPRLDFILNNACQTVRRPTGFYGHLMHAERESLALLPDGAQHVLTGHTHALAKSSQALGVRDSAELSQVALLEEDLDHGSHIFPDGALDQDLQQIDLRKTNSWRLALHEVSAVELLEVQLVNAVAPFILNARLKPLMLNVPSPDKHIVNVSAMEGQFYRSFKTDKHPHTNMAKAALNMMTRTSARDYVQDGIHMNSVDTGWVTDEDAAEIAARKVKEHGFHPPLDIVDGAARIVDPIFTGIASGEHVWGKFLKDYAPTDW